jgi:hypothetical protein
MKSSTKWFLGIISVIVLISILVSYTGSDDEDKGPHELDSFAQCLTDSGAKMYGAFNCPHCENQKKGFGSAVQYINYIECHPNGNNADPEACKEESITGYPTWIFENGERRTGETPLRELAFRSECDLPESYN